MKSISAHPTSGSRPTRPFPAGEYAGRLGRLARELRTRKLDAMIIVHPVNRLYLTGFPASNGVLLVRPAGRATFFTDFRYLEAAQKQLTFLRVERLDSAAKQLAPIARRQRWRRVGHEGSLAVTTWESYRSAIPGIRQWKASDEAIQHLRMIKSPLEMRAIRAAQRANERIFEDFMAAVRPGMSEWEMRAMMRALMDAHAQGEAFDSILATGPNSSNCHHHPGARRLGRHDILLADHGCLVQSYRSDMTRVAHTGRTSRKFLEIFNVTLEAQQKAIAAIRPGVRCKEVDAVARRHIAAAGYGDYFGHGLGHGVGLDIHERPAFSGRDETALEPGHVMTVEPGIYLPGVGGVRIEDMVFVTRTGCEVLTRTPHELRRL